MEGACRDRGGEQGLPGALQVIGRWAVPPPAPLKPCPACPIALQEQGGNAGDPSYGKLLDGLQVSGAGGGFGWRAERRLAMACSSVHSTPGCMLGAAPCGMQGSPACAACRVVRSPTARVLACRTAPGGSRRRGRRRRAPTCWNSCWAGARAWWMNWAGARTRWRSARWCACRRCCRLHLHASCRGGRQGCCRSGLQGRCRRHRCCLRS